MSEQPENTSTTGLSRQDFEEIVDTSLEKKERNKQILRHIEGKEKNLSEEGKVLYRNHLRAVPSQEGKTPEQLIDEQDNYLKSLEDTYPAVERQESEEETQEEELKSKKKTVNNREIPIVEEEEDDDGFTLAEGATDYATLEDYVKLHNKAYAAKKNISPHQKPKGYGA